MNKLFIERETEELLKVKQKKKDEKITVIQ
jgi:hypothetical protein